MGVYPAQRITVPDDRAPSLAAARRLVLVRRAGLAQPEPRRFPEGRRLGFVILVLPLSAFAVPVRQDPCAARRQRRIVHRSPVDAHPGSSSRGALHAGRSRFLHISPRMDAHQEDGLLRACERLIQVRRLDLAERELGRWLSMHPDDAYGHALMAWTLALQGRGDEALRSAGEAVQLEPDWSYTHGVMAEVLERFDQHAAAERSAREALALDPFQADYHALLAASLLNQGGRPRARMALQAAEAGLSADPGDAGCARLRAHALFRLGRRREAREAAALAVHLAPDAAASHAAAGWIDLQAGHLSTSREHLLEALRIDPMNVDAAHGLRLAGDGPRFCAALTVQVERWKWPLAAAAAVFAAEMAALAARGRLDAFVIVYSLVVLAALEGAMLWVRLRHPRLLAELRPPGALSPADQRDARTALVLGLGILLLLPLGMLLQ